MGTISVNGKCLLTNLPAEDVYLNNSDWPGYEYKIKTSKKEYKLFLSKDATDWYNDPFFKKNRHIIAGLLLNDNWAIDGSNMIEDISFFKNLLQEKEYPNTPLKKRDFLFYKLFQSLSFAGDEISIYTRKNDYTPYEYYLINLKELRFFLNSLMEIGLIELSETSDSFDIDITYSGLNFGIKLQEEGDLSNNCFIAMAFNDGTKEIRKVIKEVLKDTGYDPVLIDEKNIESDKTINDEIINNLKKCKFCIADFSFHSNGVYFESGFALGQGKKVIYLCSSEEFKNAHFDIRPLQHIIYNDLAQLRKDLINKIEVWIK